MNMQSGFGDAGDNMLEQYIQVMTDIIQPVIEKTVLLAAEYSKACGRDVLLPEDWEYSLKFCAMNSVGESIGSIMPEIYDEINSDEDEDEDDLVHPDECPKFEKYSGDDPKFLSINDAYDRWHDWNPQNPTEHLLKNAINNNGRLGAGGMDDL
jgi:hypothetical protein